MASLPPPRTDPYVQLSRIRFPTRVLTIKHCGLTRANSRGKVWVMARLLPSWRFDCGKALQNDGQ